MKWATVLPIKTVSAQNTKQGTPYEKDSHC
jgi:hypothetical protein